MKPIVFIHTNKKQMLGAKVAEYSLKARSLFPDAFDVKIVTLEDTPHLNKREGQEYLRKGKKAVWKNDDLQSFSPLRMLIPQLMSFEGRALVIDPDVFAVGDVIELLNSNMHGKGILCRNIETGYKNNGNPFYASSVMLLDCKKLNHWKWDELIDLMFNFKIDYGDWISLKLEEAKNIGNLEEFWNHFDTLDNDTKLLHNTERSTQPWKTGLPIDYDTTVSDDSLNFSKFLSKMKNIIDLKFCYKRNNKFYLQHPDKNQEVFFINMLKNCLRDGHISFDFLNEQVREKNVRSDIFSLLKELK